MTRLPRELAPWAPFLEAFPEDDVRTIWPWLPRLNTLLGPVHVDTEKRSGETDGFDGLTRRGIYDRLVSGEWALLELLPDEFVRRAAMNEQLFLKPARRSPQEAKRSVMLFDAGPDQLGAPRLVHLALLMIMARRAQASRTTFSWGILQRPPSLVEEFSAEELWRLVSARTWDLPGQGHIDRWAEALASFQPEDLWLVGSPGLTRLSRLPLASTIIVEEPLEFPSTYLSVSVARPENAPHRRVRLELPAQDAGVRLLRASSYRKKAAAPREPAGGGDIRLSWDCRRLFVRAPSGGIFAYHIPNSAAEPPGRTRFVNPEEGESILAAAIEQRRWSLITIKDGRILCRGAKAEPKAFSSDAGSLVLWQRDEMTPPARTVVSPLIPACTVRLREGLVRCAVFTDGQKALVGISDGNIVLYKADVSFCVDHTETHGHSLVMVENASAGPRRLVHGVQGEITAHPFDLEGDGTFGFVNCLTSITDRTFGLNDVGRRWRFCRLAGKKAELRFDLQQQAGSGVIGWIPSDGPLGAKDPGLLCWTEDPGVVMLVSEKKETVLFNAFKPIRSCHYHPGKALIALSTDSELVVFSLWENRELLRIQRGQA